MSIAFVRTAIVWMFLRADILLVIADHFPAGIVYPGHVDRWMGLLDGAEQGAAGLEPRGVAAARWLTSERRAHLLAAAPVRIICHEILDVQVLLL